MPSDTGKNHFSITPAKIFFLAALCLALLFAPAMLPLHAEAAVQKTEYLTAPESFFAALARREPVIYVDDIIFSGEEAYIPLNYNVRIVGKANKSTLTGVHFEIFGQLTSEEGKHVTVGFENIRFDGGIDAADFDLTQQLPFNEIFGSYRERESCITASFGYFDTSFANCEFTRYASQRGAALYCDNSIDSPTATRSITFTGCSFYNNIVQYGTCDIFGDCVLTTVTDCEFTDNYAMGQAGMSIGNGSAYLTNVYVHDNSFVPYDAPNDQLVPGGGMSLGALDLYAQGLVIENNTAYWGGGLALLSTKSGNKEIILSDCRISGNTAIYGGGALHIGSLMGQPIYFRNCEFTDNTAPLGGSLYAIPYAAWNGRYTAGLIDFSFCTFTGNTAEDNAAFSFYETVRPQQNGTIALNGCLITDETDRAASGEAPDYTLIGSSALQAASRLHIPQEAYAGWAQGAYAEMKKQLTPGHNDILTAKGIHTPHSDIAATVPMLYGICLLGSVLLLLGYLFFCKKKQPQLLLILLASCIVNIGYFCFSLSEDLSSALMSHRIAYFGNALLPVLLLLTVGSVCRLKYSRKTVLALLLLAAAMFACSATVGLSPLFYKSISYGIADGVVTLSREYGPLHTLYQLYLIAVFAAILGTVLYATLRKKVPMPRYIIMTALAVSANLIVWLIGRMVRTPYELLSFSYIITCLLLVLIYNAMQEDGLMESSRAVAFENIGEMLAGSAAERPAVPLPNTEAPWDTVCKQLIEQRIVSRREGDVLLLLLLGKTRTEIAAELLITENTVKTHITNVYTKLNVSSRENLSTQAQALADIALSE